MARSGADRVHSPTIPRTTASVDSSRVANRREIDAVAARQHNGPAEVTESLLARLIPSIRLSFSTAVNHEHAQPCFVDPEPHRSCWRASSGAAGGDDPRRYDRAGHLARAGLHADL